MDRKPTVSIRLERIIKAKKLEPLHLPFKKDEVYHKFVHTDDQAIKFIDILDRGHRKVFNKGIIENLNMEKLRENPANFLESYDINKHEKSRYLELGPNFKWAEKTEDRPERITIKKKIITKSRRAARKTEEKLYKKVFQIADAVEILPQIESVLLKE